MEISALLFLTTLVEGFTEYVFGFSETMKPFLKYIALVLGVAAALVYKVDILAQFAGLTTTFPYVGSIISGLIIGRGSNYLNDLVSLVRREA